MTVVTDNITIASAEFKSRCPLLYHYTNAAGLKGIISSNSLWGTDTRFLNDSAEIVHLKAPYVAALVPEFAKAIRQRGLSQSEVRQYNASGGAQGLAENLVSSLYQATFEAVGASPEMTACVTSFCTHENDKDYERENGLLSQWRAYGSDGGYCLVFDTNALCDMLGAEFDSKYWVWLQMEKVRYAVDGTSINDLFPRLISETVVTFVEFINGREPPSDATAAFLEAAALLKHQGFKEEQEARIVAIPGTQALYNDAKATYGAAFKHLNVPELVPQPTGGPPRVALFSGLSTVLPIRRVIAGPSNDPKSKIEFAKSILPQGIEVVASKTPWIIRH